jgi:hypothetical protein
MIYADIVININEPVAVIEIKNSKANLKNASDQIRNLVDSFEKEVE